MSNDDHDGKPKKKQQNSFSTCLQFASLSPTSLRVKIGDVNIGIKDGVHLEYYNFQHSLLAAIHGANLPLYLRKTETHSSISKKDKHLLLLKNYYLQKYDKPYYKYRTKLTAGNFRKIISIINKYLLLENYFLSKRDKTKIKIITDNSSPLSYTIYINIKKAFCLCMILKKQ